MEKNKEESGIEKKGNDRRKKKDVRERSKREQSTQIEQRRKRETENSRTVEWGKRSRKKELER